MSELPWENKKIAEIMSSAGDEAKISDSDASDAKNGTTPQIPDILANAFADVPMEEANIEVSESTPDVPEVKMPEFNAPAFGDLPDLSTIGELKEEKAQNDVPSPSPADIPPFMMDIASSEPPASAEVDEQDTKPLFGLYSPEAGGIPPIDSKVPPTARTSPPPLFEPFLPSDRSSEGSLNAEVPSSLPDESNQLPTGSVSPDNLLSGTFPPSVDGPVDIALDPFAPPAPPVSNPFSEPVGAASDPFTSAAPPVSNPFSEPAGAASDPFASAAAPVANPFSEPAGAASDPFASAAAPVANPFSEPAGAASDPFASAAPPVANPFSEPGGSPVDPFAASAPGVGPFGEPAGGNPFADQLPEAGMASTGSSSDTRSPKLNIDIGGLKKNIEGISVVARGFLRNLTKGKSLIERMEDMSNVPGSTLSDKGDNVVTTVSGSPFETEPVSPFDTPSVDPFSPSQDDVGEFGLPSVPEMSDAPLETGNPDDIRKVTPIENPILNLEDQSFIDELSNISDDDGLSDEPSTSLSLDPYLVEFVPVGQGAGNNTFDADSDDLTEMPGMVADKIEGQDISPSTAEGINVSAEISSELKAMKKRSDEKFNRLEDNIIDFKDDLGNIDSKFISIKDDVEKFSSKISELDESLSLVVRSHEEAIANDEVKFSGFEDKIGSVDVKIGLFESDIASLRSDNVTIRSDLSRIEDGVSELVDSYTALLIQLHESLQENESNFSRIDAISVKLDEIGTRISSMEKTQEGTKSTSIELSRSISSMVDNLGNTSSAFSEFKQDSEKKNAEMLKKIDSVTEYVESELTKLGAKSYKGFGQNVHLSNIVKNSGNMKLCMEWLEFLMGLVGRNNLPDILSYYEELGWITEKVRMELLHYADGIDFYMEKPDWKLTPDDHVKSIWFIESLAGMKVDKNRLSVIERDIEKVKKGTEIYGI